MLIWAILCIASFFMCREGMGHLRDRDSKTTGVVLGALLLTVAGISIVVGLLGLVGSIVRVSR